MPTNTPMEKLNPQYRIIIVVIRIWYRLQYICQHHIHIFFWYGTCCGTYSNINAYYTYSTISDVQKKAPKRGLWVIFYRIMLSFGGFELSYDIAEELDLGEGEAVNLCVIVYTIVYHTHNIRASSIGWRTDSNASPLLGRGFVFYVELQTVQFGCVEYIYHKLDRWPEASACMISSVLWLICSGQQSQTSSSISLTWIKVPLEVSPCLKPTM